MLESHVTILIIGIKHLSICLNTLVVILSLLNCYGIGNYSKYAHKINVQIICNQIGSGFYFEHGNIVLNSSCIIGDNVTIIGNCCIGGKSDGAPVIGNNCYIGYGAIIIGNINICDNVIIGAGAIITKNITSSGKYICNNILI